MPESISTLSFGVFAVFLQGKVCALSEWSVIGGFPYGQFTVSKGNQQLRFKDPSYVKKSFKSKEIDSPLAEPMLHCDQTSLPT